MVATFDTVMFPVFNPIIYSLRNKDMKQALKNSLAQAVSDSYAFFPSLLSDITLLQEKGWKVYCQKKNQFLLNVI